MLRSSLIIYWMKQVWIFSFIQLIFSTTLSGQRNAVEFSVQPSIAVRHSSYITSVYKNVSNQFQFGAMYVPKNRDTWYQYWNNPEINLRIGWLNFGDQKKLGHAYYLLPEMAFSLYRYKDWNIVASMGTGIAYLTKKYDRVSNPEHNAIGTNWNNITQFSVSGRYDLHSNVQLGAGILLSHFSNGRTSSPNYGINLPGGQITVRYYFSKQDTTIRLQKKETEGVKPSWGGDVLFGYGLSAYPVPGVDALPVYFVNAGGRWKKSPFFHLLAGSEWEYSESVYQFHYQDFDPDKTARKKATRTALYGAGELFFGSVSLRLQTGYYLPWPQERQNDFFPFYFRLGIQVYPVKMNSRVKPFMGIMMKSHAEKAQYLGIATGALF